MRIRTVLALSLLALLTIAGAASAHTTAYTADGKYKVTWGFLNEPAVTFTKTGLDLIITENATQGPVDNANGTLKVSLVYGDKTHAFSDLAPQFGTHGRYTGLITMTEPGVYTLKVTGKINDSDVDLTIKSLHSVDDLNESFFPDVPGTPLDMAHRLDVMQQQIAALQAKASQQAATTTPVTTQTAPVKGVPALELVGALAVVGVAAFLLGRRLR